jgi:Schlafen, AlbA_2
VQQPCSNAPAMVGEKLDIDEHREQIRRLVAEAPDEPTYCEFKLELSYALRKEKAELIKDVSSFATADLEVLGGHGYIIFGISNDGQVVGIESTSGDPASEARQIVNGYLDRAVMFEYITCQVDDKVGGRKRVAAIVVPDSRRRPHMVSREIKERLKHKDKFWLRKGEVWVRKTGGRELATAEDFDTMYEGKLRSLVNEQVRPLQQRVEDLERDLRERTNFAPLVGFGFAVPNIREPAQEVRPYPVLGNLIKADATKVKEKVERARKQAVEAAQMSALVSRVGLSREAVGPTAEEYEHFARELHDWFIEVQDLLFVDFVFDNTGGSPAEDVQVVLQMPTMLKPKNELPERPTQPSNARYTLPSLATSMPSSGQSIPPRPDRIRGPRIQSDDASGIAVAVWEIPKLYHDRPLITRSRSSTNGLLISGRGLREHQSQVDAGMQLEYTVRAGNVPETLNDVLNLKNRSLARRGLS